MRQSSNQVRNSPTCQLALRRRRRPWLWPPRLTCRTCAWTPSSPAQGARQPAAARDTAPAPPCTSNPHHVRHERLSNNESTPSRAVEWDRNHRVLRRQLQHNTTISPCRIPSSRAPAGTDVSSMESSMARRLRSSMASGVSIPSDVMPLGADDANPPGVAIPAGHRHHTAR